MENTTLALCVISFVLLMRVNYLHKQMVAMRDQLDDLDQDVTKWMSNEVPR